MSALAMPREWCFWRNPLSVPCCMTATLRSVNVPTASSQRGKLVTGITPLVTTWKRKRWVIVFNVYCLSDQSFIENVSFIIWILAVLSGKHRDDVSSGLLLSGNTYFFNNISVNLKYEGTIQWRYKVQSHTEESFWS